MFSIVIHPIAIWFDHLFVRKGMEALHGILGVKRARATIPPHIHFKEEVLKTKEIKYKPLPSMENGRCCKKNKNLKPNISRLKIIIMLSGYRIYRKYEILKFVVQMGLMGITSKTWD
jgi:hypothetical protein